MKHVAIWGTGDIGQTWYWSARNIVAIECFFTNEKSANIKSRGNLQKNAEKMEEIKRHNKKAATEAPA